MRVVVLLSGGIDSLVTYLIAKLNGYTVFPLTILDTGKDNTKRADFKKAKEIVELFGDTSRYKVIEIDLGKVNNINLFRSSTVLTREDVFVPTRNTLFSNIAIMYANSCSCDEVLIGLLEDNNFNNEDIMNDTSSYFLEKLNKFNNKFEDNFIPVISPLISSGMDKAEVLKTAKKYNLINNNDEAFSLACHNFEDNGCRKCPGCREVHTAIYVEKSTEELEKLLGVDNDNI